MNLNEFFQKVSDLVKQNECKTEDGVCYPASDFAVVPDRESPSTWKLRLSQSRPGNITVSQLGRAAASFSPGGFRGNRVQLSAKESSSAKARIRREYSKLGVKSEDIPDSVKELPGFYVWKEKDQYLWLATYSNNLRDQDNPPEIISSASHRRFIELVDKGKAALPELWLWHVPQWKWGNATSIAYDESGFAVAMGVVDKGCEPVAEWVKSRTDVLVSHGMPKQTIVREEKDESIIVGHVTREISPLFDWAAANKFTGFSILKEKDMENKDGIPAHKRQELINNGLSEEVLKMLEEKNQATAKETSDLEKKEETRAQKSEQAETPPVAEIPEDVVEAIKSLTTVVAVLKDELGSIKNTVKELQASEEGKIAAKAASMPDASLQAFVKSQLFTEDNKVSEKGSGPKEEPTVQEGGLFINRLGWTGAAGGVEHVSTS